MALEKPPPRLAVAFVLPLALFCAAAAVLGRGWGRTCWEVPQRNPGVPLLLQPSPSEAQSALTAGVQVAVDAEAQAAVAAAAAAPAAAAAAAAPLSPEAALEALLASTHDPFLSDADMRRGLAYRGSGARLRAFASKLLAGRGVHVAVVGGSVSWGQGRVTPGGDYGARFVSWLNATWPSPHHRFTNAAKPAVTSALYALCAHTLIPQDADLIVLEFAFNDYHAGISLLEPERYSFEQLVRRVLGFPGAPAALSMHFFAYWHAKPKLRGKEPALWYNTGEDDLAVIAQYYDLPVASLRNAALHRMYRNEPGFMVNKMSPRTLPVNLDDYFYYDDHHPYDRTGHRAMADLLVAAVQEAARDALRPPRGSGARQQQAQQQQQLQQEEQQAEPLPPPMFPGNWESPNPTCHLGASFQQAVVRSEGFAWAPQNPNATSVDTQKWAWIGSAPGAYAVLQLSTVLPQAGARARVYLGHVSSWRPLGSAAVECVGGCSCRRVVMRHQWEHQSTQTGLLNLEVSQHERCEIRVTVEGPGGPEAATILNSVMVDSSESGGRLEMGNVGQWDMMAG